MKSPALSASMLSAVLMGLTGCGSEVQQGDELEWNRHQSSTGDGPLADFGTLPDFEFTDCLGESFTRSSLQGKVWVVDFVFTRCYGPCPEMTRRMKQVEEKFAGEDGVRFLTISVDPEYDTPEVLKVYADGVKADLRRWFWVRGDKDMTFRLCVDNFYLPVEDPTDGSDQILHSTRMVVVDQNGAVRAYHDTQTNEYNKDPVGKVVRDVKKLLANPPADGTLGDTPGG